MSEFFLELFSEEVPPKLQINARKKLLLDFKNFFQAEDGIRDPEMSRGLGDVYKRQDNLWFREIMHVYTK